MSTKEAIIIVIDNGVVDGVYSKDGGPLSIPIVVIDYDDDADGEYGVEYIPQDSIGAEPTPAWVSRFTAADKLSIDLVPWTVVV